VNPEALRCLCAVVDTGSFRAAADRLFRSQPAVSQQIKGLEALVGHTLIERHTGQPTPAGELLYRRAQTILDQLDSAGREVAEFQEAAAKPLRIGTSDTTAIYFLPAAVRRFAQVMPDTRLEVINRPSHAIAELVASRDLDLGLVTLSVHQPSLEVRALYKQTLVLAVPIDHPLARFKTVSLSRLAAEPMLLLDAGTQTGQRLREFFDAHQFAPDVLLDSISFEVIKAYVAEGVGVGFLPERAITKDDRRLKAVRVKGAPSIGIGAVWRRAAYQSRAARTFLDLLAAC